MVVKEIRGRRRYILFSTPGDIAKEELLRQLRAVASDPPYIIQCINGKAILRCSNKDVDETVSVMKLADPRYTSITTSGTLKTIRDKHPDQKVVRKPKK